jgi:hypothetical protein
MDFEGEAVVGTVSDGNFLAQLQGDRAVFSTVNPAVLFAGQYTLIIPGTNDPALGPFGTSYGTAKVAASGKIALAGGLADGTAISQSSVVSKDGFWPFYVSLYNGKGSLWGWACFTNHGIIAAPSLSWINLTNASARALYRSGFANHDADLQGSLFVSTNKPLLSLTEGVVLLSSGDLPWSITNHIGLTAANLVTNAPGQTNKLALAINKTTGMFSGSFANPANPVQTLKFNGVLMQNQSNAAGYFPGTNKSGRLLLE